MGVPVYKVLILQPDLPQALALARYIKRLWNRPDHLMVVGGYVSDRWFPKSLLFDMYVRLPTFAADWANEYDWVIPTGAQSTHAFIKHQGGGYVGSVHFSEASLACYDKKWMLNRVKALGVPIPDTFDATGEIDRFPVFYKATFEDGVIEGRRKIIGVVHNGAALSQVASHEGLMYQEVIEGPCTYGVGFLATCGRMDACFVHEERLSLPLSGGSGVVLEEIENERILALTKRILESLNYSGWGLAEYKFCKKRDDYVFMELNGKFWASLRFALLNDARFMEKLFGLPSVTSPVKRVVFLDRMIRLGFVVALTQSIRHLPYRTILEWNLFRYALLSQCVNTVLPERVKRFVLKCLRACGFF